MNSPVVYITISGMILSVLLFFYNDGYKKANAYLAGFFFISSVLHLVLYIYVFSHSLNLIGWVAVGLPSINYLVGPFAFFYVRSILRDNTSMSKADYIHFLPFFIVFGGTLPYIFSDLEVKLNAARVIEGQQWGNFFNIRLNSIVPVTANRILKPIHTFSYSASIWAVIYQYRDKLNDGSNASFDFRTIKKWILIFAAFFIFTSSVYLIGIFFYNPADKASFISETHMLMIIFSFSFLLMLLSLLLFPSILYGMPSRIERLLTHENSSAGIDTAFAEQESAAAGEGEIAIADIEKQVQLFSAHYVQEISQRVEIWIKEEHFLNADVTLATMAVQMQVPMHHLSYYFNVILSVKFTDWRNNLRVNYAKSLLDQNITRSITMEALSVRCGFASQTTFNRAFKNLLGVTPSQYIRLKE